MGEIKCRNCGNVSHYGAISKIAPESRLAWVIHPKGDTLLSAGTVGGTLAQLEKLLRSVGRQHGERTVVLVEKAETQSDGGIRFDLLVMKAVKPKRPTPTPTPSDA